MYKPLAPCPACKRHVRTTDAACPFCSATLPHDHEARAIPAASARMSRAAAFVFTATLAASPVVYNAAGCGGDATRDDSGDSSDSDGDGPDDDGGGQAEYGAPAPDGGGGGGPPDDGGMQALYGDPTPMIDGGGGAPPDDGGGSADYGAPPPRDAG